MQGEVMGTTDATNALPKCQTLVQLNTHIRWQEDRTFAKHRKAMQRDPSHLPNQAQ